MRTAAVIQARMNSNRLPGKVMLPLDGVPVIEHIISRLKESESVDELVVATSEGQSDDIIETAVGPMVNTIYRGSESDVLGRMFQAAKSVHADTIVRVCADNPFVSGKLLDHAINKLTSGKHDYVSTKLERTLPLGFDIEAFTMESFVDVEKHSSEPYEREHVTVYYRENPDEFSRGNVSSNKIFQQSDLHDRTELRLTLDEAADYMLMNRIYEGLNTDAEPSCEAVIRYIDNNSLSGMNHTVDQKSMFDSEIKS